MVFCLIFAVYVHTRRTDGSWSKTETISFKIIQSLLGVTIIFRAPSPTFACSFLLVMWNGYQLGIHFFFVSQSYRNHFGEKRGIKDIRNRMSGNKPSARKKVFLDPKCFRNARQDACLSLRQWLINALDKKHLPLDWYVAIRRNDNEPNRSKNYFVTFTIMSGF